MHPPRGADVNPTPEQPPGDVDARRRRWLGAAALSGIAWPGRCWSRGEAASTTPPAAIGEPVAWPAVTLLDGRRLTGQDLLGQATVVVLFATTCPFCRRHNQRIEQLAQATRGQPLRIVAAAQDDSPEPVRAYQALQRLSFPVTLDEAPLRRLLTPRRIIPLTAVIDRSGRLREVIPGEMAEADVLDLAKWARS
jgi:thiol-disulfide isomerase/thioredoxin